ncbi:unnamed protein product [Pleuronectes platessa]|uniref:Uncharacterized protein n=1 Tax=Pleuronectes platessa TaxID=8262 RepID=A0A9N7ZA91_PLEPL|nr:unnamed protein product [Pleuronectes platessa]
MTECTRWTHSATWWRWRDTAAQGAEGAEDPAQTLRLRLLAQNQNPPVCSPCQGQRSNPPLEQTEAKPDVCGRVGTRMNPGSGSILVLSSSGQWTRSGPPTPRGRLLSPHGDVHASCMFHVSVQKVLSSSPPRLFSLHD